ncbi:MAG: Holliday junction resolvase Hjc [Ignisphaera sp.]
MSDANTKRIKSSGASAERELVRKLWKMGFAVIRGPASGAKIKRGVYPDLVALKDSKIFVFEVKRRKELKTIYVESKQVLKIIEFARRAGGEPLLAIRIDSLKTWRVIELNKIIASETISNKNIRIGKEVIESAEDLFTYLSRKLSIGLDKFMNSKSVSENSL